MKKMKVALLVPNFVEFSGDARVVDQQAKELSARGNDVTIFAFASDFGSDSASIEILGMPRSLFWQRIYRLLFPLDIYKAIKWLPKLKNYDCVVAHLSPMTYLASLGKRLYGFKYVFWYHGAENPNVFSRQHERIYMYIHLLLTKYTIRNVDQIVSVSNFARDDLKKCLGYDSKVVYNKIDKNKFNRNIDRTIIRNRLGLGDSPVILNVGRIGPQKGVHLLIQAFEFIKVQVPDSKLVIVGDFTFSDYGKTLINICDKSVIFVGHVSMDEIQYYYAMCDIYATCSLYETFNLPVAEAQACGKCVIAFNIGPFGEVVDKNGILVEKGNIEEFAGACIKKLGVK